MTSFIYAIELSDGKIKIGHSENVSERKRLLGYPLGNNLIIRHKEPVPRPVARYVERLVMYRLQEYEVAGEIFFAPLKRIISEIQRAAEQLRAGEMPHNGYIPFKKRQYPDRILSPYNYQGTRDRIDRLSADRPRNEVLREALAIGLAGCGKTPFQTAIPALPART